MTDQRDIGPFLTDREERELSAAWMLPPKGALSDDDRAGAMMNFAQYIRARNITTAKVAREIGKPQRTTIDDLVKGKYNANSDGHIRKLNNWVEQHAARAQARSEKPLVSTKVAKAMMFCAKLVAENQTMGLVFGPTGIGKSRCAEAISQEIPGSIFVRAISQCRAPSRFIQQVYRTIGGERRSAPSHHGYAEESLIKSLQSSKRLLIVDEAHQLSDGAIEVLRDLHDLAGIPILLIATETLFDRLQHNRHPDGGQLFSRFQLQYRLTEGFDVPGGPHLFTVDDIRQLYQTPKVRLATDAEQYLKEIANDLGSGSLRTCDLLVPVALKRARKRTGAGRTGTVTLAADDLFHAERTFRHSDVEQRVAEARLATAKRRKTAGGAA